MPGTRRRVRAALVAGGVAAAVLVGTPALAAVVPATRVSHVVTAPTVRSGVERTATRLHGWDAAPTRVRQRQRFAVPIRVSGGQRIVRLERLQHGEWHRIDRVRTSSTGSAVLDWRAATAAQHVVLRIRVPATATRRSLSSTVLDLRITRPAASTPRATSAPSPAPTSTPVPVVAPSAAPTAAATPSTTAAPVTALAPTPTPTPTAADAEAARLDALREPVRARLLALVDEARATPRTCGDQQYPAVPALTRSTALDDAAQDWADRMAFHDFFAHEADGSTMVTRLNAVGISGGTMRENIAAGQTSPETVMAAWLSSPGHCANLMAPDVTAIGFGHTTATDSHYSDYWVQDFAG